MRSSITRVGSQVGGWLDQDTLPPPIFELATDEMLESEVSTGEGAKQVPQALPTLLKPTGIMTVNINQCDSTNASLSAFIAGRYSQLSHVFAVYDDFTPDSSRTYVLLSTDDDEAMDRVFDLESFFYDRFPGERLDFVVLPGLDLETQIPSQSRLVWKRPR